MFERGKKMNHQVPFQQVDVFTEIPFKGNPVAVILDGNELSTEQMQAIANWTNLSETTFVCKPTDPQADYRLRIFTPNSELPFAGHPTIGSAFAVIQHGIKPKTEGQLVQECGTGLVTIFADEDKLFLSLPNPKLKSVPSTDVDRLAKALGVDSNSVKVSETVDVGAIWITIQLSNAEEVRSLRPDMAELSTLIPSGVTGVTVFGLTSGNIEANVEVRSFAPKEGIDEDPVCGSGNGCVAAVVKKHELIGEPTYVASQGFCVGRNGKVEVRFTDHDKILLGGHAVTCIEGKLNI